MQVIQKATSLFPTWQQFLCMNDFPEIHDIWQSSSGAHWSARQNRARCWLVQSCPVPKPLLWHYFFLIMNSKVIMEINTYWSKVITDKILKLVVTSGIIFIFFLSSSMKILKFLLRFQKCLELYISANGIIADGTTYIPCKNA